jgi:hypothetical protein
VKSTFWRDETTNPRVAIKVTISCHEGGANVTSGPFFLAVVFLAFFSIAPAGRFCTDLLGELLLLLDEDADASASTTFEGVFLARLLLRRDVEAAGEASAFLAGVRERDLRLSPIFASCDVWRGSEMEGEGWRVSMERE